MGSHARLTSALAAVALAGGLAGCGDEDEPTAPAGGTQEAIQHEAEKAEQRYEESLEEAQEETEAGSGDLDY